MPPADDTLPLRREVSQLRSEVSTVKGHVIAVDAHLQRNDKRFDSLEEKLDRVLAGQAREGTVREVADHDHTASIKLLQETVKVHDEIITKRMGWRERAALLWAGGVTALAAAVTILHYLGRLP